MLGDVRCHECLCERVYALMYKSDAMVYACESGVVIECVCVWSVPVCA